MFHGKGDIRLLVSQTRPWTTSVLNIEPLGTSFFHHSKLLFSKWAPWKGDHLSQCQKCPALIAISVSSGIYIIPRARVAIIPWIADPLENPQLRNVSRNRAGLSSPPDLRKVASQWTSDLLKRSIELLAADVGCYELLHNSKPTRSQPPERAH